MVVVLTKQGLKSPVWPLQTVQMFETLKKAFASAPILNHPDTSKPFFLEVDASYGAGVHQRNASGKLLPCGFFSRKFSSPERNYGSCLPSNGPWMSGDIYWKVPFIRCLSIPTIRISLICRPLSE